MKRLPVLGPVEPDPIGLILGTGYMRFEAPCGVDGLAKTDAIEGGRIDILAVHARTPGKGQFREFIQQCKQHYGTICVWEDWNPAIGPALQRYGFTPETEIQGNGEAVNGWRWDR